MIFTCSKRVSAKLQRYVSKRKYKSNNTTYASDNMRECLRPLGRKSNLIYTVLYEAVRMMSQCAESIQEYEHRNSEHMTNYDK